MIALSVWLIEKVGIARHLAKKNPRLRRGSLMYRIQLRITCPTINGKLTLRQTSHQGLRQVA